MRERGGGGGGGRWRGKLVQREHKLEHDQPCASGSHFIVRQFWNMCVVKSDVCM